VPSHDFPATLPLDHLLFFLNLLIYLFIVPSPDFPPTFPLDHHLVVGEGGRGGRGEEGGIGGGRMRGV
jgi:hypothetical protein